MLYPLSVTLAVLEAASRPVLRGALYALGGFAVFALHDALIKSLTGYSPFQILFFAVLFSYVPFSFSLVAVKAERHLRPVNPGWMLVRTACMVGSSVGGFIAFRSLPLNQAYALLFAMPMVITVLAIPLLGERVRPVLRSRNPRVSSAAPVRPVESEEKARTGEAPDG